MSGSFSRKSSTGNTASTTTTSSREGETNPLLLSPRLQALHSHFCDHESIWDIGCDHGKLGLSFATQEGIRSIHLVDPSTPVTDKLKHFIDSYITNPDLKITIENKKGQEIVPGPEKKLVFIAGMGGKEILSILQSLTPKLSRADDVVISPHRDILLLRSELHQSVFRLGRETLVQDEGRFYQILSLNLRDQKKVHLFGEDIFRGETGESYRRHQKETFSAHQDVQSRDYVTYLEGLTQRF